MEDKVRKLAWGRTAKKYCDGWCGDTMIDKRTGEVLDPEVDFTYWKDKF